MKLTDDDHREILRMFKGGVLRKDIAARFGVAASTIGRIVDPGQAERDRRYLRQRREAGTYRAIMPRREQPAGTRISPEDEAARLAEIPQDTRDLTSFVFGDPLPGRSALDRRQDA